MKTAKTTSTEPESEQTGPLTPGITSEASPRTPGGKEVIQGRSEAATRTSATPMASPFLGFEVFTRRLVANGYAVPKIAYPIRGIRSPAPTVRFASHQTTLYAPDELAIRWFIGYVTRSIQSGGVEELKARIKFDTKTIRRWMLRP